MGCFITANETVKSRSLMLPSNGNKSFYLDVLCMENLTCFIHGCTNATICIGERRKSRFDGLLFRYSPSVVGDFYRRIIHYLFVFLDIEIHQCHMRQIRFEFLFLEKYVLNKLHFGINSPCIEVLNLKI